MGQLTQDNRYLEISDFSLGKDTFLLTTFSGRDSLSALFEYQLHVISENLDITPEDVIGKTCSIVIKDEEKRVFHGFIKSFSFGEIGAHNVRQYQLTMVPWLWFLSQTNEHRIFQELNTKDIVSQVFNDLGFTDFEFRAEGGEVREYCIQHNESDFHFISRLLEEEGIAYYFKHDDDKHQLILVDQQNAYDEFSQTKLEYSKGSNPDAEISSWTHRYQFRKGKWSLNDYDYKTPDNDLTTSTQTKSKFANNANYEHYEYADIYDFAQGPKLAAIRLDAEEADRSIVDGASNCSSFYSGGRFNLASHTTKDEKGDYIVTAVSHQAFDNSHLSSDEERFGYSNDFSCIPSNVHFRPKQAHRKAAMKGPQTAVVVGPEGEEIYVDELGRIKVQFIWDRVGENNENSSCYLRVIQMIAGNQWGSSFIPRIGHEVIVSFMDGDPDRPIVTGSVYNSKNRPPFSSKTQNGIRTRSSKGGTLSNCNELRFDDKKDAEQILIHAEKNLDTEVENDETHFVDNDRTKTITHDENSTIGNDRNKSVANNQTESIGKDKTIDVAANHTESIGKNMSISVTGDLKEVVSGMYTENVTKEYGLKAKTITMQADEQITLKTGSAKIVMKSNGDITISGNNINLKGSGNIVMKGSKVTSN